MCPDDNSAPVGRERNHRGTPYSQNKRHRKIYRPAAGHSERCRRATDGSRRLNGLNAGSFQRSDEALAYAIGVAEPVMIEVDTFGTGKVCADDCLVAAIPLVFGVTPVQIMESLRLNRPIFRQTAVFGHFGRKEFPWERTDKVLALQDTIL